MARFQKGQSGNEGGRPKSSLSKLLSEYLQTKDGKKTREQMLVEKLVGLALNGDFQAIRFIWERLEGKVQENVALSHDGLTTFTLNMGDKALRQETPSPKLLG